MIRTLLILPTLFFVDFAPLARAREPKHQVTFSDDQGPRTVAGRIVASDQQGGMCVQDDGGQLWLIESDKVIASTESALPFKPATREQIATRLMKELGERFKVHETDHYVVAHATSRRFAQWLSSLLERLHRAYFNYWSRRGIELNEPEFPLVVIVFADRNAYLKASANDLGGVGAGVVGYYSLKTNRVSMYDLTGVESLRSRQGGRTSLRDINRMLSHPEALPLVSTIVHEATHQVAFNVGLTQRFADLPLWYVEGMAIYFEAPDLSNGSRWRGIGKVNHLRLRTFRESLSEWDEQRLIDLITNDQLFRRPKSAAAAYADAWALTYFLIKQQPDAYQSYAAALAKKKPFEPDPQGTRRADFIKHFGPLAPLLADFLRHMVRVR